MKLALLLGGVLEKIQPPNATRLAAAHGLEWGLWWSEYKHLPELLFYQHNKPQFTTNDIVNTPMKLFQLLPFSLASDNGYIVR